MHTERERERERTRKQAQIQAKHCARNELQFGVIKNYTLAQLRSYAGTGNAFPSRDGRQSEAVRKWDASIKILIRSHFLWQQKHLQLQMHVDDAERPNSCAGSSGGSSNATKCTFSDSVKCLHRARPIVSNRCLMCICFRPCSFHLTYSLHISTHRRMRYFVFQYIFVRISFPALRRVSHMHFDAPKSCRSSFHRCANAGKCNGNKRFLFRRYVWHVSDRRGGRARTQWTRSEIAAETAHGEEHNPLVVRHK